MNLKGRQQQLGTIVAYDSANLNSKRESVTTSIDGGLGTLNRVTLTVGDLRYFLYQNGSGNYAVLCLDSNDTEVFNYSTSTAVANDPALLLDNNESLCIFDTTGTETVRVHVLDSLISPSSVSTTSKTLTSWGLSSNTLSSAAFESLNGVVMVAVSTTTGSNKVIAISKYEDDSFDSAIAYSIDTHGDYTIDGDIQFGDAKPGVDVVPLYLPTQSFTCSIDSNNYTRIRILVGADYSFSTAEAFFSAYRGWGDGFNQYIKLEDPYSGANAVVLDESFATFEGDTDHILCSSYFNENDELVEGLTKHDIYVCKDTGVSKYDITETISNSKKPTFYHYENGRFLVDLMDYSVSSDVYLESRAYEDLSTAYRVVSRATGHNPNGSTSTPYSHYQYSTGVASTIRYVASADEILLSEITGGAGYYLKTEQDIIDDAVTAVGDASFPYDAMGFGDSSRDYNWINLPLGVVSVIGESGSVTSTDYFGGGDSSS